MNPNSGNGSSRAGPGHSKNTSRPAVQSTAIQKRQRGRRTRRDSGSQLEFITVLNPDEFGRQHVRSTIRSRAMKSFRRQEALDALEALVKEQIETGIANATTAAAPEQHMPSVVDRFLTYPHPEVSPVVAYESNGQTGHYNYHAQSLSFEDLRHGTSAVQSISWVSSYMSTHSLNTRIPWTSSVTGFEQTERHEEIMMRMLIDTLAPYHRLGDGINILEALPSFRDPQVNTGYLIRRFVLGFATELMLEKWLPIMIQHPQLVLTFAVVGSAWDDITNNCPGDSPRTTAVKVEALAMVKELIQLTSSSNEAILLAGLNLLASEMWSCDKETVQTHERGLTHLLTHCGGVRGLENQMVAEVAAAYSYHCAVVYEMAQSKIFIDWSLEDPPRIDAATWPESPLFCPQDVFVAVTKEKCCSKATRSIISDMRNLTDLFIANKIELGPGSIKEEDEGHRSRALQAYNITSHDIRLRTLSLLSAEQHESLTCNDWVYEACRLAAIIYAEAIVEETPFSKVGDPNYFRGSFNSSLTTTDTRSTRRSRTASLVGKLYEALKSTDLANVWNDMAGVLYWVCAVGAAAARTPDPRSKDHRSTHPISVRRFLHMNAARTMMILVSGHPIPMIMALKKLLKVQELISIHDAEF